MTVLRAAPDAPAALAPPRPPRRRPRLLLALLGGVVLSVAFPPYGLELLAPAGVALLGGAVRGLRPRTAALAGLVCGLAMFLPMLRFVRTTGGPAAWLLLSLAEAGFVALLAVALAVTARLPGWPLVWALLWVGQEALRDRLPFGGFPWGRLAFSQPDSPYVRFAALGGAPLVTFAVALSGALLLAAATRRPRRAVPALAGAALVALVALAVPLPTGGPPVRVAVVQGGVPRLGLDAFSQRAAVLGNHVQATEQLAADVAAGRVPRPDLVVWPENASDLDPFTDPGAYPLIDRAVRAVGVPVLVGAVLNGPGRHISNDGIVWDPVTGPGARYVKQHPVPFGEYIPFRSLIRAVTARVDLVPRDFVHGGRTGVLQVGPARLGDVICFEVAYDDLVRAAVVQGGRLLVVQTNNATFGRSGETEQQLAMGRLRAVEHGRAVLVAATSGISAVIAPDGRVQQSTGVFTRGVLSAAVPQRTALTVADRVGAGPELVLSVLGALAVALAALRARA